MIPHLESVRAVPVAVQEIMARRARQIAEATSNPRHSEAYKAQLVAGINARMASELAPIRETLMVAVEAAEQSIARLDPATAALMQADLATASAAAEAALSDADAALTGEPAE